MFSPWGASDDGKHDSGGESLLDAEQQMNKNQTQSPLINQHPCSCSITGSVLSKDNCSCEISIELMEPLLY